MRKGLLGALVIWMVGSAHLYAQSLPPIGLPELVSQGELSPPNPGSTSVETSAQHFGRFPGMGLSFSGFVQESEVPYRNISSIPDPFAPETWNVEWITGYYHSPNPLIGPKHWRQMPRYDFIPVALRLGKMWGFGIDDGPLRGRLEGMAEITGAPVTGSFGHFWVGTSMIWRYNFVQPNARLVPYMQVGLGISYNDGYKDTSPDQWVLGQSLEFVLDAHVGARYFISDRVALNFEGGLTHISNGGLARRNQGANGFGGSIGITYFLGSSRLANGL
jgi:hypothetical protein